MFRLCVVTMVSRIARFNSYLLVAVCLVAFAGCESTPSKEEKKKLATLRVHLETTPDGDERTRKAKVFRANPIEFIVEKDAFLDESQILDAAVTSSIGGYAIVVGFDRRGTMLLEQYSARNPGRHFAIIAEWGEEYGTSRWLAAPIIRQRLGTGRLSFTPDCTREEADAIVLGLNLHAKKNAEYKKKPE